jgi:hypothetical protein
MSERWTAAQCAQHCDLKGPNREHTWRYYVHQFGAPTPLGHNQKTGLQEWDADAVRTWKANRPGQGRRTDLGRGKYIATIPIVGFQHPLADDEHRFVVEEWEAAARRDGAEPVEVLDVELIPPGFDQMIPLAKVTGLVRKTSPRRRP